MRYLSLYTKEAAALVIDLINPDPETVRTAVYLADKYGAVGYVSNYKNVFKADFQRTAESSNPLTSRQIKLHDLPQRLEAETLMQRLEALQRRGSDRRKRSVHPNSLANLKPHRRFTSASRPSKPRKLTDEQLDRASELRDNGCSWRQIGDALGVNHQTVRTSLRRRSEQPNQG